VFTSMAGMTLEHQVLVPKYGSITGSVAGSHPLFLSAVRSLATLLSIATT
jgi:hypothetical protein